MLPSAYLHQGSLSAWGIAELARTVAQCAADIRHNNLGDDPAAQQALYAQQLAPWHAVPVWVEHRQGQDRCTVFLSEGEMLCAMRRMHKPRREGTAHVLEPAPQWQAVGCGERSTLGALLALPAGLRALSSRLDERCVAPYTAADFVGVDAAQGHLVWSCDNGWMHPTALLCAPMAGVDGGLADLDGLAGALPLCLPAAWGKLHRHSNWLGRLHLHHGHVLVVCDASGQYGLMRLRQVSDEPPPVAPVVPVARVAGQWLQPCEWAWLAEAESSGGSAVEAARTAAPDARGELVGDLIDPLSGQRVNPSGVKALLGTSHYSGTNYDGSLVVNEAGQGAHTRVLGRVTRQGMLLCGQAVADDGMLQDVSWGLQDLRWLEMGEKRERMIAVRDPGTGLWGYVDDRGALAIALQYADAWGFTHGAAVVQPVGEAACVGLIDQAGQWLLPPVWRALVRESRRVIVAQDAQGQWGALDGQGAVTMPFQPAAAWLEHPQARQRLAGYAGNQWITDPQEQQRRTVIETIAALWKMGWRERIRAAVQAALGAGGSLAGLQGLFDGDTSERDLHECGVWGLPVTLLRGVGESGRIACYYPVGLSTFGLAVEAPVSGLPSHPEASIGISWRDLTVTPRSLHADDERA